VQESLLLPASFSQSFLKLDYGNICKQWGSDFLKVVDDMFTSFSADARMPPVGFYHLFFTLIKKEPTNTMFVGIEIP
jgi:hypothetical protein